MAGLSSSHLYALTCFLTCLLALLLGAFVLWKNPKHPAARWWVVLCVFVAAWAFWNTLSLLELSAAGSVRTLRIADAFALFIPTAFLHFAMQFSGQVLPKLLRLGYAATGLIALTVPTSLFVSAGRQKFGIWFEVGGPAFAAFAALFLLLPGYGLWLMWKSARGSTGTRRAQLLCLFFASALGFGGGFMWFPPAFNIDIPPLGGHLIALYCVIVMYSILRYQFLDIQVIIRRSLVYSLLVTLLTVGYFGLVYGIERALQITLGYHSAWISLTAFALMALVFQPLKSLTQRMVDRLIFGMPQEQLMERVERLELTVADTGSGISPALLPKIFDPFVTTKSDGNSLGLAVVYSILQAHRGSIRADSAPGGGTTFTVSLPL